MKSKAHLLGLIMKKCGELKFDKNIDAFCNYSAHCNLVEIDVYKDWNNDSNDKIYQASISTDGSWNNRLDASTFYKVLEDLDAIYLGLGIE
ncbi:hypothetical protein A323_gp03 [Acinetobacter phage AP22]|uniref:Uncharacterized protein n=1 Tax=Acinetobacter phage AP22 TaxID=1187128 RepID=I2GUB0_9CAUD|nr:hypothetical protein A323_gp03 [Acinetobacter phage AP22]CCH57711.1 hypothetical protein [Acinetobacter phage AP22]